MKKALAVVMTLALVCVFSSSAFASYIYSDVSGGTGTPNTHNYGEAEMTQFRVNTAIKVTKLGFHLASSTLALDTTYTIDIWDKSSTGSPVASLSIGGGSAGTASGSLYLYLPSITPVTLGTGDYVIRMWLSSGSTQQITQVGSPYPVFSNGGGLISLLDKNNNVQADPYDGTQNVGWGSGANKNTQVYELGGWDSMFKWTSATFEFEVDAPPIPEPAGLGLLGVALLAMRKRRS